MKQLLYEISHTTAYEYDSTVFVSHHLLRLAPRSGLRQRCLAHDLAIDPNPAVVSCHADYFGNTSHFVTVEQSHPQLIVTSRSRVALRPAFIPDAAETPNWESVRAGCRGDRSIGAIESREFIFESPLVPIGADYAEYAEISFARDRPVVDAAGDLARRVQEDFTFDPSATTVTTPVSEVFKKRKGVCQDFAQFQIACLRSLGLPARYVSGYLETDPPPGQAKLRGADASHAWVSFFCPGIGWIDVDPTNNCFPNMRHITIGWGRDYGDVCPIRGVIIGGQDQELRVSVDVVATSTLETDNEPPADQA